MIAVIIPFALPVKDIMLPWSHAIPSASRINTFVASTVKTVTVFYKQPANEILRVICHFHKRELPKKLEILFLFPIRNTPIPDILG